jgi:hypothetical protein
MELVHTRGLQGEITPRELHRLEISNPERILCRLTNDGYLVRIKRGVYRLPEPGRVVVERTRVTAKKRHTVRKGVLAPEALPIRGIKKGSSLALDKEPILPGDTVLFRRTGSRTRLGVLLHGDGGKIVTLSTGIGEPTPIEGEPKDFTRVAGCYSRRTQKAARARDEHTPHVPAPPHGVVYWVPPKTAPSNGDKS